MPEELELLMHELIDNKRKELISTDRHINDRYSHLLTFGQDEENKDMYVIIEFDYIKGFRMLSINKQSRIIREEKIDEEIMIKKTIEELCGVK